LIENLNSFDKIKGNYEVINNFLNTNFAKEEANMEKPSAKNLEKFIKNQEKKIFSFSMSILSFLSF